MWRCPVLRPIVATALAAGPVRPRSRTGPVSALQRVLGYRDGGEEGEVLHQIAGGGERVSEPGNGPVEQILEMGRAGLRDEQIKPACCELLPGFRDG